jgi:hypothetical protein
MIRTLHFQRSVAKGLSSRGEIYLKPTAILDRAVASGEVGAWVKLTARQ